MTRTGSCKAAWFPTWHASSILGTGTNAFRLTVHNIGELCFLCLRNAVGTRLVSYERPCVDFSDDLSVAENWE